MSYIANPSGARFQGYGGLFDTVVKQASAVIQSPQAKAVADKAAAAVKATQDALAGKDKNAEAARLVEEARKKTQDEAQAKAVEDARKQKEDAALANQNGSVLDYLSTGSGLPISTPGNTQIFGLPVSLVAAGGVVAALLLLRGK